MEQNGNAQAENATCRVRIRPCLVCGAGFVAEGPFIRVCGACKEGEEWQSGNVDFTLHAANDN